MNCIILRRTFSVLPFLRLLGRQKEETEGKEGEGGWGWGLGWVAAQKRTSSSGPHLPSLSVRNTAEVLSDLNGESQCVPPLLSQQTEQVLLMWLSAFSSSCLVRRLPSFRKVHSILKGWGYKTQFNPLQKRDGEGEGEGKGKKKISGAIEWLDEDNVHK